MRNILEHQTPREKDAELIERVANVLSELSDFTPRGGKRWYPSTVRAVLATERETQTDDRGAEGGAELQPKWEEPSENS